MFAISRSSAVPLDPETAVGSAVAGAGGLGNEPDNASPDKRVEEDGNNPHRVETSSQSPKNESPNKINDDHDMLIGE